MEVLDPQWAVEQFERIDRELEELRREMRELHVGQLSEPKPHPGHDITGLQGKPRAAYFLLLKAHERGDQPNAIITSSERNGEYDHRVMLHRETARSLVTRGLAFEVTWEQSQDPKQQKPHGLYLQE